MSNDGRSDGDRPDAARRAEAEEDRLRRLASAGIPAHPEAAFLGAYGPRSVLELGCGTGRICVELARRGITVVGVEADRDELLVGAARESLEWVHAPPERLQLRGPLGRRRFDAVVCTGRLPATADENVRRRLLVVAAGHLLARGILVTGMQVTNSRTASEWDADAERVGLDLDARYSSWTRDPWGPGDRYLVSVYRRRSSVHLPGGEDAVVEEALLREPSAPESVDPL